MDSVSASSTRNSIQYNESSNTPTSNDVEYDHVSTSIKIVFSPPRPLSKKKGFLNTLRSLRPRSSSRSRDATEDDEDRAPRRRGSVRDLFASARSRGPKELTLQQSTRARSSSPSKADACNDQLSFLKPKRRKSLGDLLGSISSKVSRRNTISRHDRAPPPSHESFHDEENYEPMETWGALPTYQTEERSPALYELPTYRRRALDSSYENIEDFASRMEHIMNSIEAMQTDRSLNDRRYSAYCSGSQDSSTLYQTITEEIDTTESAEETGQTNMYTPLLPVPEEAETYPCIDYDNYIDTPNSAHRKPDEDVSPSPSPDKIQPTEPKDFLDDTSPDRLAKNQCSQSTIHDFNTSSNCFVSTKSCFPEEARALSPSPLRHEEAVELDLDPSFENNDIDPGFRERSTKRRERYEILGLSEGLSEGQPENSTIANSIKMTLAKLTRNLYLSSNSDDQPDSFYKSTLDANKGIYFESDREDVGPITKSIKITVAKMTKNRNFSSIAYEQPNNIIGGICYGLASNDVSTFAKNLTVPETIKNLNPLSTLIIYPQVSDKAMLNVTEGPCCGVDRNELEVLNMIADGSNNMEEVMEEEKLEKSYLCSIPSSVDQSRSASLELMNLDQTVISRSPLEHPTESGNVKDAKLPNPATQSDEATLINQTKMPEGNNNYWVTSLMKALPQISRKYQRSKSKSLPKSPKRSKSWQGPIRVIYPKTEKEPAYSKLFSSKIYAITDLWNESPSKFSDYCTYDPRRKVLRAYSLADMEKIPPDAQAAVESGVELIWLPSYLNDMPKGKEAIEAGLTPWVGWDLDISQSPTFGLFDDSEAHQSLEGIDELAKGLWQNTVPKRKRSLPRTNDNITTSDSEINLLCSEDLEPASGVTTRTWADLARTFHEARTGEKTGDTKSICKKSTKAVATRPQPLAHKARAEVASRKESHMCEEHRISSISSLQAGFKFSLFGKEFSEAREESLWSNDSIESINSAEEEGTGNLGNGTKSIDGFYIELPTISKRPDEDSVAQSIKDSEECVRGCSDISAEHRPITSSVLLQNDPSYKLPLDETDFFSEETSCEHDRPDKSENGLYGASIRDIAFYKHFGVSIEDSRRVSLFRTIEEAIRKRIDEQGLCIDRSVFSLESDTSPEKAFQKSGLQANKLVVGINAVEAEEVPDTTTPSSILSYTSYIEAEEARSRLYQDELFLPRNITEADNDRVDLKTKKISFGIFDGKDEQSCIAAPVANSPWTPTKVMDASQFHTPANPTHRIEDTNQSSTIIIEESSSLLLTKEAERHLCESPTIPIWQDGGQEHFGSVIDASTSPRVTTNVEHSSQILIPKKKISEVERSSQIPIPKRKSIGALVDIFQARGLISPSLKRSIHRSPTTPRLCLSQVTSRPTAPNPRIVTPSGTVYAISVGTHNQRRVPAAKRVPTPHVTFTRPWSRLSDADTDENPRDEQPQKADVEIATDKENSHDHDSQLYG